MGQRAKYIKGGAELLLGNAGQQAITFLRNVILARLLGPDDFGIAITFAIIVSAVEMVTDAGIDKFIVHAPDGNAADVQGSLHAFLIARGLILAGIIFVAAEWIGRIFDVPDASWAYRWLALIPLLKGFVHLDTSRFHRKLNYRPGILVEVISVIVGSVSAAAFAFFLRSFEAMLWAQLIQVATGVIGTHLVARRAYGASPSGTVLRRLCAYGWPLMANGAVLFAADQGDRLLVGASLGVRELAIYGTAVMITFGPSLLILKVTGALYMPLLSQAQSEPKKLAERLELSGISSALASVSLVIPIAFFGDKVLTLLFGTAYAAPPFLVAWLAVAAAATVLRSWLIAASLASGQTELILKANLFKFVGLALALAAVHGGYGAVGVAIAVAAGQTLTTTYFLLASRGPALPGALSASVLLGFLIASIASIAVPPNIETQTLVIQVFLSALILLIALTYFFSLSVNVRRHVTDSVSAAYKAVRYSSGIGK